MAAKDIPFFAALDSERIGVLLEKVWAVQECTANDARPDIERNHDFDFLVRKANAVPAFVLKSFKFHARQFNAP